MIDWLHDCMNIGHMKQTQKPKKYSNHILSLVSRAKFTRGIFLAHVKDSCDFCPSIKRAFIWTKALRIFPENTRCSYRHRSCVRLITQRKLQRLVFRFATIENKMNRKSFNESSSIISQFSFTNDTKNYWNAQLRYSPIQFFF